MGFVFFFSTYFLGIGDLECEGEVGGDGEGILLLEWPVDLDLLAIHSQALLLAPKMLMHLKSWQQHWWITTQSGP